MSRRFCLLIGASPLLACVLTASATAHSAIPRGHGEGVGRIENGAAVEHRPANVVVELQAVQRVLPRTMRQAGVDRRSHTVARTRAEARSLYAGRAIDTAPAPPPLLVRELHQPRLDPPRIVIRDFCNGDAIRLQLSPRWRPPRDAPLIYPHHWGRDYHTARRPYRWRLTTPDDLRLLHPPGPRHRLHGRDHRFHRRPHGWGKRLHNQPSRLQIDIDVRIRVNE